MATPLTADQLLAAFTKWGVPYVEHDGPGWDQHGRGWRTHNRAVSGRPWGPVHGVMLHHTGDDAPDSVDLGVLWRGRAGLPGPLCHWGMDDEGIAHLIGWGRANHAGGGDPRVLAAVIAETKLPAPHQHEGSPGAVDGNAHFYGQESFYSGRARMTAKAYRSTVLAFAAVCDAHGWSARSDIGHREWSDWKSDPGSLDMVAFRADVQRALDAGPAKAVTHDLTPTHTTPAPAPAPPQEDDEMVLYYSDADPAKAAFELSGGQLVYVTAARAHAVEKAGGKLVFAEVPAADSLWNLPKVGR